MQIDRGPEKVVFKCLIRETNQSLKVRFRSSQVDQIFCNLIYKKMLKKAQSFQWYTIIYIPMYVDVQPEHSLLMQRITKDEAQKHKKTKN